MTSLRAGLRNSGTIRPDVGKSLGRSTLFLMVLITFSAADGLSSDIVHVLYGKVCPSQLFL